MTGLAKTAPKSTSVYISIDPRYLFGSKIEKIVSLHILWKPAITHKIHYQIDSPTIYPPQPWENFDFIQISGTSTGHLGIHNPDSLTSDSPQP